MKRSTVLAASGALALGYGTLYRLGRTWGATRREREDVLAGDEIVADPPIRSDHALTIKASPGAVWPWIVQMGYHRGGWYTYPWVDRLVFHMSNPSADRILPEYQGLKVGDTIPDGLPGTAEYRVIRLEPARLMVLHSTSHLPPSWRNNPGLGVSIDWTWTFRLTEVPPGETRLQLRVRGDLRPWWLRAAYHAVIVPADFVMARRMLRGIRQRAEQAPATGG